MDKKTLNNEIIMCRGAVRKARVGVIRKIIRNMKILKSCKNEAMKEKKLKKSERLYNKIQIIKKLKDDDVTKFALLNKDLEKFLKGTSSGLKENAMACLAKHKAVVQKVENIREQFSDWEMEIPLLLDSLGKKKKLAKKTREKKEQSLKFVEKITDEVPKRSNQVPKSTKTKSSKKEIASKIIKSEEKSFKDSESEEMCVVKTEPQDSEFEEVSVVKDEPQAPIKQEKIDDPFFIGKKVIAPKLLLEPPPREKVERKKRPWEGSNSVFLTKPFKVKKEPRFSEKAKTSVVENEKLHPSWAAKKVQLIQPFQGKKIKFDD